MVTCLVVSSSLPSLLAFVPLDWLSGLLVELSANRCVIWRPPAGEIAPADDAVTESLLVLLR
jgi:hypothetical protein